MLRSSGTALLATFTLAAAACHDPASERVLGIPAAASAARAGSSNPQLQFQFESEFVPTDGSAPVAFAITADGLASFYTNNVCGVFAIVNLATTDGLLDPDANYSSRSGCGPRFIRVTVKFQGDSTKTVNDGAYITVGGLGRVTTTSLARVGFQLSSAAISTTGCSYVRYGYPGDIAGTDSARTTLVGT